MGCINFKVSSISPLFKCKAEYNAFYQIGYRKKLLNYKDLRENLCGGEDMFLSVPEDSDLGKSLTFEIAPYV